MKFKTQGVCSSSISFEVKDGRLANVSFENGCPGNLQAIAALVEGMKIEEVITRLKNIRCGDKESSCADQLVRAIESKL